MADLNLQVDFDIGLSKRIKTENIKVSENTAFAQTGDTQSAFNTNINTAFGALQSSVNQKLGKSELYNLDLNGDVSWVMGNNLNIFTHSDFNVQSSSDVSFNSVSDFKVESLNDVLFNAQSDIIFSAKDYLNLDANQMRIFADNYVYLKGSNIILGNNDISATAQFTENQILFSEPLYLNGSLYINGRKLPDLPGADGDYKLHIQSGVATYIPI